MAQAPTLYRAIRIALADDGWTLIYMSDVPGEMCTWSHPNGHRIDVDGDNFVNEDDELYDTNIVASLKLVGYVTGQTVITVDRSLDAMRAVILLGSENVF